MRTSPPVPTSSLIVITLLICASLPLLRQHTSPGHVLTNHCQHTAKVSAKSNTSHSPPPDYYPLTAAASQQFIPAHCT